MPRRTRRRNAGTPFYRRPTSSSLFPGVVMLTDDDKCRAFIGRFQKADDGSVYNAFMGSYASADGTYDITNRALKNMYKRFLLNGGWDPVKYARITFWILENGIDVNSYSYARGSRLYDAHRLPTGLLETMDYDVIMWIINGDNANSVSSVDSDDNGNGLVPQHGLNDVDASEDDSGYKTNGDGGVRVVIDDSNNGEW